MNFVFRNISWQTGLELRWLGLPKRASNSSRKSKYIVLIQGKSTQITKDRDRLSYFSQFPEHGYVEAKETE